jgi:hypothetical protein
MISAQSERTGFLRRAIDCKMVELSERPLRVVISIDRRNTLIFVGKMECWNEVQASDIFYR